MLEKVHGFFSLYVLKNLFPEPAFDKLRQRVIKDLVAELVEATASTNKLRFSDLTFFCLETKEPKIQVWKSSAKNE